MNGTQRATATIRFGVGDVYVMAGQSNAQGYPYTDATYLSQLANYDCVSVHNYNGNCRTYIDQNTALVKLVNGTSPSFTKVGTNGHNSWCYAELGRLIAVNAQVPSAFFNAAAGGSTIENWRMSSTRIEGDVNNTGATNSVYSGQQYCSDIETDVNKAKGQPYLGLKNALKYYGKVFGIKAVLWHQGEDDKTTASATYQAALQQVITKSRTDFGNTGLTWYVARASYVTGTTYANVIAGQNAVITAGYAKAGPATDAITVRAPDNIHIYKTGLDQLAALWHTAINAIPGPNLFSAITAPTASFQMALPGYPLQVLAGYSQYSWNSRSAPTSTTQTSNNDGFCYIKDSNGNWLITPKYTRGSFCGLGGGRMSADLSEETIQEVLEADFNFSVSSNPVVDESSYVNFDIPNSCDVTLEIIDESGQSIKKLADGPHDKGKFTYPLWMKANSAGTYICVLRAGALSLSKRFVLIK